MKTKQALFGMATVLSMGCLGGQAVQIDETPDVPAERWQGALASPPNLAGAVQVQGTAWMATGDSTNRTRVQIDIANASPGGIHPWEVQRGRCGGGGQTFGSPDDFEPLEIGRDGEATATADVAMSLPRDGEYSVEVLASPTNRELVVACANLAPPVQRGDFR